MDQADGVLLAPGADGGVAAGLVGHVHGLVLGEEERAKGGGAVGLGVHWQLAERAQIRDADGPLGVERVLDCQLLTVLRESKIIECG